MVGTEGTGLCAQLQRSCSFCSGRAQTRCRFPPEKALGTSKAAQLQGLPTRAVMQQKQKDRRECQGRSWSPWVCYFVPPQLSLSLHDCGGGCEPPPVPAWGRKGPWSPKVEQFRNWFKAKVDTQIPESVMHDTSPAHQQQWPKHSKEIVFGKWFQHHYKAILDPKLGIAMILKWEGRLKQVSVRVGLEGWCLSSEMWSALGEMTGLYQ